MRDLVYISVDEVYHDDESAKKRFCSYRNLTFWLNPGIKKKQRTPLPACLYSYIQRKFPPSHNNPTCVYNFSRYVDL